MCEATTTIVNYIDSVLEEAEGKTAIQAEVILREGLENIREEYSEGNEDD